MSKYKLLLAEFSKNFTKILTFALVFILIYVVYRNFTKIVEWFKYQFNKVSVSETPEASDFTDPTFVIDSKIISNYVDILFTAMENMGTDEIAVNDVFLRLKNTAKENTIAVWNEWNRRGYKYRQMDGTINPLLGGGEKWNLYQVLSSELKNSQSEKNVLTNWTWLLKKHGLI